MSDVKNHEERIYDLLEDLGDARAGDVLHLLGCAGCQDFARKMLRTDQEAGGGEGPAYGELLKELEAKAPGLVQQMEAQAAEAKQLMERLLGNPPGRRMKLAGTPEFRSLRLAELLLLESWGLQPAEPAMSEELADLAYQIAFQPWRAPHAGRADEVKVRASVLLANARRLVRDRPGAEDYFQRAAFYLACPPDSVERAFYCQMLAALRREQGRDDEAAGLLWRAAQVYNECSALLDEGVCLADLGFLFVYNDQAHLALSPLTRACRLVDLHHDPILAVRARLALALCQARLGHEEKARRILEATRPRYPLVAGSSLEMAQVTWIEGRVAALTGNLEDARNLLDTARKSFLQLGRLYDAGFASLDLAVARARAGRLESLHDLIHDVVETFPATLKLAGVLRALGMVQTALLAGGNDDLEDVAATAAEQLRHYRRNPNRVFEGGTRPPMALGPDPVTDLGRLL